MKRQFLLGFLSIFLCLSAKAAEPKPNILFIAIDDLRPELSIYGTDIQTPNFDRIGKSAVVFNRAYCQQAVCGASRLSIMSGLYPTRTKEHTFHVDGWRKRHPNLLTMNQHFGANGYQTIGLGKIYHGSGGVGVDKDNWDEWLFVKTPQYANKESYELIDKLKKAGNPDARGPSTEMADKPDDFYIDGSRAKKAAEVLKKLANQDSKKPFFLAVGFNKPHLPFVAPKKYWDLYQREDFKMPKNLGIPPGWPVYAANQIAGELGNYGDITGSPKEFPDELNQRLIHGYYACTSYADANLGVLLDALDQNNLTENTIVVIWGDHGWKLGDHTSWCKHTNFECDTRVPLIVRAPGLAAGKKTERLVELIDLYPTLCDLTGLDIPEHCQGKSFQPLLADPEIGHRQFAYSCYPAKKQKNKPKEVGHSIRFGNYRYTEWIDESGNTTHQVLTNLKRDPGEETNWVKRPEAAEALAKAKGFLKNALAFGAQSK